MRRVFVPLLALAMLIPLAPAPAASVEDWWTQPLLPHAPPAAQAVPPGTLPVVATPIATLGDDVVVPIASNQDEFSIAANPLNPDNLVAGANDYCCSAVKAGYFTTFDGGQTWTHGIIATPGHTCGGDPALAAGPDGTFWYIGITGFCGDGRSTIFAAKSTDGGLTWQYSEPIVSTNGELEDKPYVTVDQGSGAIVITWTRFGNADITVTRSADGGATWSPWQRLGGGQFSQPVVAPNGDIYVTWASGGGAAFARSLDHGATWTTHTTGLSLGLPSGLVNFRYNPTPTIGVIPAGSHAGRIYLAGPRNAVATGGGALTGSDIAVVTSDDRGSTWSPPDVILRPGVEFMPWMAVMPDGTVGIAAMDTILSPDTWSAAAGHTAGSVVLSQSLSTKKPEDAAWVTTLLTDVPSGDPPSPGFWGDYQGLAATSKGFHPAFPDFRDRFCSCGANNGEPDFGTMRVGV